MSEFDHNNINEIIHGKIRLGVMALLNTNMEAEFTFIRDTLKTTDGNLSVHLQKLEKAGYLKVKKSFLNRKPLSMYRITPNGQKAFDEYLRNIEKLLGM